MMENTGSNCIEWFLVIISASEISGWWCVKVVRDRVAREALG